MKCCPQCFGDRQLARVINEKSSTAGTCGYCKNTDVPLVDPRELQDLFLSLTGVYQTADEGRLLVEWFRDDWGMFRTSGMDNAHARVILSDVLEDGEIVRGNHVPVQCSDSKALELWEEFREELRRRNRFFFEKKPDLHRLRELFDSLISDESDCRRVFVRARVHSGKTGFPAEEMGAPDPARSKHGRANPVGIPYLYLASDPDTVVAEVRPHKGQFATVAEFTLPEGCQILDLRNPKEAVSPFLFADEQEILRLRADLGFLEHIGNELSTPVLQDSAEVDYLPSQYLCEYAKHCGFDGVFYGSSVGTGFNLAIFDPNSPAVVPDVVVYLVSSVDVKIRAQSSHD